MWMEIAAILLGIALLVWSADRFVESAAELAEMLGISPLLIGLSVVAFGTSAPELVVSAVAAFSGDRDLGIGNAVGSNITNIALVLGMTAVIAPIAVPAKLVKLEYPIMLLCTTAAGVLLYDGTLGIFDGMVLIGLLALAAVLISRGADGAELKLAEHHKPKTVILLLIAGLLVLMLSSKMLVWGAEHLALRFNISGLVIGLTIVALGTSLPELAASIAAALKKHSELAIGNVIGSNIFNIAAVMAMPAFIHPGMVDPAVYQRDFWIMLVLTLAVPALAYAMPGPRETISRFSGALLLMAFISYYYLLYVTLS